MASCSMEYDWSLMPLDVFAVIQSVIWSFRTGDALTYGQPRKSSCHKARYFSRSVALTYVQYAFSELQICASSLTESCAKAVEANTRRLGIAFNMARLYSSHG